MTREITYTIDLSRFPAEVQNCILEECDLEDLVLLARCNSEWYERAMPLIWGDIDFPGSDDEQVDWSTKFFGLCDIFMQEFPERWPRLAARVKSLHLGRLHGVDIAHPDEFAKDQSDFLFFGGLPQNGRQNVFDIISTFTNLHTLVVYIKNWWGGQPHLKTTGKALAKGLTNLRVLKTGGQLSDDLLQGLLSRPEQIECLSLKNLHYSPGQNDGPDGFGIGSRLNKRFTSLHTLSLCKLGDLDGRLAYTDDEWGEENESPVSGMRWGFPRESELQVFEDWAALLHASSPTLVSVTLENRFLTSRAGDELRPPIDPGGAHPADYGSYTMRKSREMLLPAFTEKEWPRLQELKLIGMGKDEDVSEALASLADRVEITCRLADIQSMGGDATPEQISTPPEFHRPLDEFDDDEDYGTWEDGNDGGQGDEENNEEEDDDDDDEDNN